MPLRMHSHLFFIPATFFFKPLFLQALGLRSDNLHVILSLLLFNSSAGRLGESRVLNILKLKCEVPVWNSEESLSTYGKTGNEFPSRDFNLEYFI